MYFLDNMCTNFTSHMPKIFVSSIPIEMYTNCSTSTMVIYIYYCTTGRAIWGNIQLEGGSIGPTEGRDNTEPES